MSFNLENIYRLLPAFARIRDIGIGNSVIPGEEHDGPLKALLQLVAEQVAVLEENLDQLYDDQFIETCSEWVVPYIGELVGTRGLSVFPGANFSQRGEVANTLSYRRRKGTATVIEQLARDVTGWNASVVEYFQLLCTTQYLNHLRPQNLSFSTIKNQELLEYFDSPFDRMPRTAEVRRIDTQKGRFNIQNIGIFLWRLNSYSLDQSPAYRVDARRYTFDALGKDIHLFNAPIPEESITHLSDPSNVPAPLNRRIVKNHLHEYYGAGKSFFIVVNGIPVDLTVENISPGDQPAENDPVIICDLRDKKDNFGNVTGWGHTPEDKIAVDPVLGRIAFPSSAPVPENVQVNYHYGFSDNIGGGGYVTTAGVSPNLTDIMVVKVPADFATIQPAIQALEATGGIIEITNNEYYPEKLDVHLPAGKKIEIRAGKNCRPVLVLDGDMDLFGGSNAEISFSGLLFCGGRLRTPLKSIDGVTNELRSLSFLHCTLLPGKSPAIGTIAAQPVQARLLAPIPNLQINIDKSIVGTLRVNEEAKVNITNSIVDASGAARVAFAGMNDVKPGGTLHLENCTIIGTVKTVVMELASNTIFFASGAGAPISAERLQEGCVRFCYVPPGSRLPRKYHCQPANATVNTAFVRPVFTSLQYGDAGYCQLSRICSKAISRGADNESEMGVFNRLYGPQREQNLITRLNEYLRFGLDAGIFYAS